MISEKKIDKGKHQERTCLKGFPSKQGEYAQKRYRQKNANGMWHNSRIKALNGLYQ